MRFMLVFCPYITFQLPFNMICKSPSGFRIRPIETFNLKPPPCSIACVAHPDYMPAALLDNHDDDDSRLTGSSFLDSHRLTTYSSCHSVLLDIAPFVHTSFLILCPETSFTRSSLQLHLQSSVPGNSRKQPQAVVSWPCYQLFW